MDIAQQSVPEMTEAATDHHGVDVDRQHEHPHRCGDTLGKPSGDRARLAVAVGRRGEEGAGGQGVVRGPLPGDAGSARHRLQAAALTAAAEGSCRVDGQVADLAGHARGSPPEPAVDDDARRHPGPEVEVGHRPVQPEQVERSEGRRLHVVLDPHSDAEPPGELTAQGEALHAEVDRVGDLTRDAVDHAGDADADGREALGGESGQLSDAGDGGHRRLHDGRVPESGREADAFGEHSPVVDGDRVGLRAADVDAESHGLSPAPPVSSRSRSSMSARPISREAPNVAMSA